MPIDTAGFSQLSGKSPKVLANAVSDAIHAAVADRGMGVDEAVCVTVAVAADYARAEYGDRYLEDLGAVVQARTGQPMPEDTGDAAS